MKLLAALSGASNPLEPCWPTPEAIASALARSPLSEARTSSACKRAYTKKLSAASMSAVLAAEASVTRTRSGRRVMT